jgi:hypothetical protein
VRNPSCLCIVEENLMFRSRREASRYALCDFCT